MHFDGRAHKAETRTVVLPGEVWLEEMRVDDGVAAKVLQAIHNLLGSACSSMNGRIRARVDTQRTGQGWAPPRLVAKAWDGPFKLNAHQRQEAVARRPAGQDLRDIARTFGVSSVTVWRLEQASLARETA